MTSRSLLGKVTVAAVGFLGLALAPLNLVTPLTGGAIASAATNRTFTFGVALDPGSGGCDGTQILYVIPSGECPILVENGLVSYNSTTHAIEPSLATSWTDTGPTLTFHLRPNVTFQDGTPFNAAAVVFNFRRVWDASYPAHKVGVFPYAQYVLLKSVSAVNNMTVQVTFDPTGFNETDALEYLAWYDGLMQSPTAVQKWGKSYPFHAVGTGPYSVVSYTPNQEIVLTRNSENWGAKPQPTKVIMLIQSNFTTLANDLSTGAIDAVVDPDPSTFAQLKAPGITIATTPSTTMWGAFLNTTRAPFNDMLVRQAVNYAVDKNAIAQLSDGGGVPMYSAWFAGLPGNNTSVPQYAYDPAKARQLLDQAGWLLPAGAKVREKAGKQLQIVLASCSGTTGVEAVEGPVVISDLQDVGFKVTSTVFQNAVCSTDLGNPSNFDIALWGRGSLIPSPSVLLKLFECSDRPPADVDFSQYCNPAFDKALNASVTGATAAVREANLYAAENTLRQDAPYLWTLRGTNQVAYNSKLLTSVPFDLQGQLYVAGVTFR
jgi:peptide/nickel transport system substrate-binding protein